MCEWLPLEFSGAQIARSCAVALSLLALLVWESGSPFTLQITPDFQDVLGMEFIAAANEHVPSPTRRLLTQNIRKIHQQIYKGTWPWIKINSRYDRLLLLDPCEMMLHSHKQRCFIQMCREKDKLFWLFIIDWMWHWFAAPREGIFGRKEKMRHSNEAVH